VDWHDDIEVFGIAAFRLMAYYRLQLVRRMKGKRRNDEILVDRQTGGSP